MSRLTLVRFLLIVGLAVTSISLGYTISHIWDPTFVLVPEFALGTNHGYYHVFREAGGDLAAYTIWLVLFFGPATFRTPLTWWITVILMIGYYSPYWIGIPFNSDLSAPNFTADLVHMIQAAIMFANVFIAKPLFNTINDQSA